MAQFDRYDIAEAYAQLDIDWNWNGMLPGRRKAVSVQLHNIKFRPGARLDKGFEGLSNNGKEIYLEAEQRLGLK